MIKEPSTPSNAGPAPHLERALTVLREFLAVELGVEACGTDRGIDMAPCPASVIQ